MLPAAGISHTAGEGWQLSVRLCQRSSLVRADEERTGRGAEGQRAVSVNDDHVGQLLYRQITTEMNS